MYPHLHDTNPSDLCLNMSDALQMAIISDHLRSLKSIFSKGNLWSFTGIAGDSWVFFRWFFYGLSPWNQEEHGEAASELADGEVEIFSKWGRRRRRRRSRRSRWSFHHHPELGVPPWLWKAPILGDVLIEDSTSNRHVYACNKKNIQLCKYIHIYARTHTHQTRMDLLRDPSGTESPKHAPRLVTYIYIWDCGDHQLRLICAQVRRHSPAGTFSRVPGGVFIGHRPSPKPRWPPALKYNII